MEVSAQVTGIASFFGIHFTTEAITDYRSVVRGNREMRKALFMGLLNEGVLLQESCAGSLNILTTESDVDVLVDATRKAVQRIR